jgi:hypothetical protein
MGDIILIDIHDENAYKQFINKELDSEIDIDALLAEVEETYKKYGHPSKNGGKRTKHRQQKTRRRRNKKSHKKRR